MCARKVLESPNWNHFLFTKTLPLDFAPFLSYDVINNTIGREVEAKGSIFERTTSNWTILGDLSKHPYDVVSWILGFDLVINLKLQSR